MDGLHRDSPDQDSPDQDSIEPDATEALGNEIARLSAHIHAATHRLLVLIRAFDEQEGWAWGFRSCAEWLAWRTGISPGPAREKVWVARALGDLPLLSQAMARGELAFSGERARSTERGEGEGNRRGPVGRAERFQVVVHVEAGKDELGKRKAMGECHVSAETSRGHVSAETCEDRTPSSTPFSSRVPSAPGISRFPPETAKRIACDADLVEMTHDPGGGVLDVGRKRRTIPPAIRRALDQRDGGCRFPGCGCRYADAHHIVHWAESTLFLRHADALHNLCERVLKKAILHRKNSLFYKTFRGARVGDLFMSLIHTAELCRADAFDYLVALQRHHRAVALSRAQWMPWNYKASQPQP